MQTFNPESEEELRIVKMFMDIALEEDISREMFVKAVIMTVSAIGDLEMDAYGIDHVSYIYADMDFEHEVSVVRTAHNITETH